ncbi:stress-activated map kinase interacting protein 1-domain-containing protein [Lasiosphaeria miniovina]|uniref:Stress-activated map kinase interacting protein 1-domain-containing protein n=1 Tax=Lasiosphaeria miniovina TaxID=1954250 RepID=A0AA40AUU4_9PEZI|nr:stress-activated map kinase interacting protein 1-domain-containing protein [Lasiosphaeria miniovina]KAK0722413.1 stress-activated map kinase interacting protein 1-domain-containing protein [Lasiosphaeria miniovina]
MSMIQVEDLVLYQLRTSYLNDVADGVGERLFTLNESFLNAPPFKSAGWRPNPALIKRTHSPPIPTAVASEYFQAPRVAGLSLEDEGDEGGLFGGGGASDTVGPGMATKRRRRREQMEDDDSSDLSDESDDEPDQRAAQQIKFAKMPLRNRSGSSPLQSSTLRQTTTLSSPKPAPRRGSQSALETVKERARRDTVTSSEMSSENEFDASGFHKQREAARAAGRGGPKVPPKPTIAEPTMGIRRHESDLLPEEEEDDDEDEDSDGSDMSSAFLESLGSASILDTVKHAMNTSPRDQVVGTPPREFTRRLTIRKSAIPAPLQVSMGDLPPPRPMSTIRPLSMLQPKSLLSAALKAKKTKPALPFDSFASLSGQGDPSPIMLRIYSPFSKNPSKPFEVLIRRTVHQGEGGDRSVTVADLIGLSLWRYNEEKLEPTLPSDKLNVNWWTLRMVEEDGEVDDDFPPLDRRKQLTSFTTANNKAGRSRSNSKVYDIFALVQASESEFAENQRMTPQFEQEAVAEEPDDKDLTPRNTPRPDAVLQQQLLAQPRENPLLNTTYRADTSMFADMPQPAQPASSQNTARGEKKLLRIHIHSADVAPGQMITLDVTTGTWLAEVLDTACRKRQLDKANHVLKVPNSGTVVLLDRTVASLGNVTDLDLYRRRFATDGPLTMTGSPSSSSPRPLLFADNASWSKSKRAKIMGTHPLAKEALKQDELGVGSNYKKYTVWRKQPMRLLSEKLFAIDGEYIHIMPASGGKMVESDGKTTSVHFSNVVGCKVSRKHPTNFKLVVYKATESKRYDFVTNSLEYAAEIVQQLKKGISPYRDI